MENIRGKLTLIVSGVTILCTLGRKTRRLRKATGVCSLLIAYPGTQSGKSLGGKLAKITINSHHVLGKTQKSGNITNDVREIHYYKSKIHSKNGYFTLNPPQFPYWFSTR